jgi:hypothetical protein
VCVCEYKKKITERGCVIGAFGPLHAQEVQASTFEQLRQRPHTANERQCRPHTAAEHQEFDFQREIARQCELELQRTVARQRERAQRESLHTAPGRHTVTHL